MGPVPRWMQLGAQPLTLQIEGRGWAWDGARNSDSLKVLKIDSGPWGSG